LKRHRRPEWLDDAKFGIYYHWGIYSVPACGPNGSWYPNKMYSEKKWSKQFQYHLNQYGHPSKFGLLLVLLLNISAFQSRHFGDGKELIKYLQSEPQDDIEDMK
jgi:hypothetical protein